MRHDTKSTPIPSQDRQDVGDPAAREGAAGRPRRSGRQTGSASPQAVGRGVREILVRLGRPLGTRRLLPLLEEKGIVVLGWNRSSVLGVVIRRRRLADGSRAFLSVTGGYWPADVPLPPGVVPR